MHSQKKPTYKVYYREWIKPGGRSVLAHFVTKAWNRSDAINKFSDLCDRSPSLVLKVERI